MGIPKRVGLVELFVEVDRRSRASPAAAVMSSIRRNADTRLREVLDILKDLRTANLELIVFPGWTVVGSTLPVELVEAAKKRTVVVEVLPPPSPTRGVRGKEPGKATFAKAGKPAGSTGEQIPWHTYVIHRGVPLGPMVQRIITSADAGRGSTPSHRALELDGQLRRGERSWSTGCSLWICGEVNALYGRSSEVSPWVDDLPVDWRVIANPAHTPSRLQAMRDKRAHLSTSGVLFTTANIHNAWTDSGGQRRRAGRQAAELYRGGNQIRMDGGTDKAFPSFWVGEHRVVVIE